jgi:hypothetical protein
MAVSMKVPGVMENNTAKVNTPPRTWNIAASGLIISTPGKARSIGGMARSTRDNSKMVSSADRGSIAGLMGRVIRATLPILCSRGRVFIRVRIT